MSSIAKPILDSLKTLHLRWCDFEALFLSVETDSSFNLFLASYRGHSEGLATEKDPALQKRFVAELEFLLNNCLLSALSEIDSLSDSDLKSFESALNCALYYWHGRRDRNFQFRAIIHFLGLSGVTFSLGLPRSSLQIQVSEWGIGVSKNLSFSEFPARASLARICGIRGFEVNTLMDTANSQKLFSKIRLLQREFCMLIDEWEHCNSILAVQQFSLRKMAESESSIIQKRMAQIAQTRNELVFWCAETTADFQEFVARARSIPSLSSDILAELNALDALLLAGFQKFLLPGSVSRHVYSEPVIRQFMRSVQERLQSEPDDVYSLFAFISFSTAVAGPCDFSQLEKYLSGRSFDWFLSADPSTALKAVSWGLSPAEHQLLTFILIVLIDAKLTPQVLDSHWLQTIAGVVEMPGSFPVSTKTLSTLSISPKVLQQFRVRALQVIEKSMTSSRDEGLKAALFVKEFILSEQNPDQTQIVNTEGDC